MQEDVLKKLYIVFVIDDKERIADENFIDWAKHAFGNFIDSIKNGLGDAGKALKKAGEKVSDSVKNTLEAGGRHPVG